MDDDDGHRRRGGVWARVRVSSVSGERWRRTSRVELGARGVRGEERDGRGCGERESLRGGDNLIGPGRLVRCVGRCGRRAGDEGGAADAAALASATLAGRTKGQGESGGDGVGCHIALCRGAARRSSGAVGAEKANTSSRQQTGPPAGQSQKMMKLSSHSQSSVYVLCFAAASLDAPSSSRTARRCIAPPAANPKPRPVPAVVGARRPRASSIPSARMRRE